MAPHPDDAVLNQVREAQARGGRVVIAFDADGTLWKGDVGEKHIRDLGPDTVCSPHGDADSHLTAYMALCDADVEIGYRYGCEFMAGLDEQTVIASCDATWRSFEDQMHYSVSALLQTLQEMDAECWIVSASHRWIIESAAQTLGVPAGRIIAANLDVAEGILGRNALEPFPNGTGKVACIRDRVGVRPVVAFGNSIHDAAMLDHAEQGVLVVSREVPPSKALLARAEGSGWLLWEVV